ncbi:MAG: hypothetical protein MK198_06740 [Gracilimonas sp.]|uniref:hypothetical protein n=1 Tax=Gracilimonas sp. TaxID=1974203 RepID=UPI003751ED26|nr:hypothetical protein [Gracilimonas sp.]
MKTEKTKNKTRFITAQQAERIYGVNSKTLLNRSGLPASDVRYIPSLKLKGGRRKYFERKLLDRLFIISGVDQ